ncbi:DNA-binding NarL/FixJ family response regulator [Microbacterium sp. AK009]|uniref:response regulator n=1 Tax=Microbacterium sp. AK009 TaxID=2723068 RepID=UPI0015C8AD93|nr:response regulator transcription factor [Microbacterium sp. AK009]NYF17773.1 DNA-binding NarL/FixJ family response regulator [Microbacterium sp. AK009]
MLRVFLVDDHEILRRGLADILEAHSDIEVIGEAGTVRDALSRIEATSPDIAVLDVHLPDGNGIDLCREIGSRLPHVRCLILTAFDDDAALHAATLAGAAGYVLKDIRGAGLVEAIRAIAAGRRLINSPLGQRSADALRSQADSDDPRWGSLGLRERQILRLIADGMTNRQIGERLGIAEKTVKNYVSSLLRKLGVDSRTQAAIVELHHTQERADS